jgi:hypothetical protein
MTRTSKRRPGAALLLRALMLGAALPALVTATPAAAQAYGERRDADHPVWVALMTRYHWGEGYKWTASTIRPGELAVELTEVSSSPGRSYNRIYRGDLKISADRRSLQGELVAFQDTHRLKLKVTTSADGSKITLQDAGSQSPFKTITMIALEDRAEAQAVQQRNADWIGDWSVNGQTLKIRADGRMLVGTSYLATSGGREQEVYRFAFEPREGGKLVGAWQQPQLDASPYNGGPVELELTADKRGFVGDIYSTGRRDTGFRGTRVGDTGWSPTVVQGDIQPKPGYISCNSWCRVKLEGHEIKEIADSSGQFGPIIFYTVSVHNISLKPQTISADLESGRQGTISFWAYEGEFSANKPYASTMGPVKPWDPTKLREMIYDKPVVLPPGAEVKLTYMLSPQGNHLPRNPDTLRLRTNEGDFSRAPEVRINNPADWLCPVYRREQEIFARGDTKRKPWTLPEICGGPNLAKIEDLQGRWIVDGGETFHGTAQNRSVTLAKTPGALPALQFTEQVAPYEYQTVHRTAEAVWTGVTTLAPDFKTATFVSNDRKTTMKLAREGSGSEPAPSPVQPPRAEAPTPPVTGPAPAPTQPSPPPVVVAQPVAQPPVQPVPVQTVPVAGAARTLAQPGVFHALDDFDVRLDQVVPARDGAVNVFVTVKNKAGREKYISTAAFLIVQLTDSDGVSVRQNQMYRATAEGSELLPAGMTLPADGELKGRFTITPPEVHGPLRTVSIRQSDKKAVWFDASGADANPSPFPAPAAGRGAFKPLSNFDLRIDNIAPARDGKLEAFITLRNPGRDWRYLGEGNIKLRGTDSDGAIGSTLSQHYSVRGERGRYDQLPAGFYLEPGAETRMRLIWERPVSGPIKVSDGTVEQVFTAGG